LELTFHHLIPRTLHSRKSYKKHYTSEELDRGVDICQDCHDAIHRFIPETVLGSTYNTIEKLRTHEKLMKFVRWVAKRSGRYKTDQPVWHRRG
jgi:hypothetical protein